MTFDDWFRKTFPQYSLPTTFLEPMYSVAQAAYEQGYDDGLKREEKE